MVLSPSWSRIFAHPMPRSTDPASAFDGSVLVNAERKGNDVDIDGTGWDGPAHKTNERSSEGGVTKAGPTQVLVGGCWSSWSRRRKLVALLAFSVVVVTAIVVGIMAGMKSDRSETVMEPPGVASRLIEGLGVCHHTGMLPVSSNMSLANNAASLGISKALAVNTGESPGSATAASTGTLQEDQLDFLIPGRTKGARHSSPQPKAPAGRLLVTFNPIWDPFIRIAREMVQGGGAAKDAGLRTWMESWSNWKHGVDRTLGSSVLPTAPPGSPPAPSPAPSYSLGTYHELLELLPGLNNLTASSGEIGQLSFNLNLTGVMLPLKALESAWRMAKPLNGWVKMKDSLAFLPQLVPGNITHLIDSFSYVAPTRTYILETTQATTSAFLRECLEALETGFPGMIEWMVEDGDIFMSAEGTSLPNDPGLGLQYSLKSAGLITEEIKGKGVNAWGLSGRGEQIVVAMLDSGVNITHPDLKNNVWVNKGEIPGNGIDDDGNGYVDDVHGFNFINNSPDIRDDYGHGTFVAGILAATANNSQGIAGVAPAVQLMVLKVLDEHGVGTLSAAAMAIQYSLMMQAQISCNSYGGGDFTGAQLERLVREASNQGQLFIAAAGNRGEDIDQKHFYPASYSADSLVSVMASGREDCVGNFSNWGTRSVHLAAPGVDVVSTTRSGYAVGSGTSFAAPVVAGASALMLSMLRQARPSSWLGSGRFLKEVLLRTVDPVPGMDQLNLSGGRLNITRAVLLTRELLQQEAGAGDRPIAAQG